MSTRTHIVSYDEPPEGFPGRRPKPDVVFWIVAIIVGITCLFVGWFVLIAGMIPPKAMTHSAIGETSVRIGLYFQHNKKLPPDLTVLPVRQGYMNSTVDGWKHELSYTIDDTDAFSLGSLGRDGKPGGTGDDADILQHYRVINGEIQSVP